MYKMNQRVQSFDNTPEVVNIESKGIKSKSLGYTFYFDCKKCLNRSTCDDEKVLESCNNHDEFTDMTDTKMYCRSYKTNDYETDEGYKIKGTRVVKSI